VAGVGGSCPNLAQACERKNLPMLAGWFSENSGCFLVGATKGF
jgi:hypothetical protein